MATTKTEAAPSPQSNGGIMGLNDKLVGLIDKMRGLQDQNKALETRLNLLQEKPPYKANIDELVEELRSGLRRQVEGLALDNAKLQQELVRAEDDVERSREKYEEEVQKKAEAENDFVINKKVVDDGFLQKIALELELEELQGEVDFLKRGYQEEIKELESMIQNATVVLEMEKPPELDMKDILDKVKAQYEAMAARAREDAEQCNQQKMEDMMQEAGKREQDVKDQKSEIAELIRQIQRLKAELEILSKQKVNLQSDINECEKRGKLTMEEAQERIALLREALKNTKQTMALHLREYQDLLSVKLGLDIEIATYKKLLEGEEMRMTENGIPDGAVDRPDEPVQAPPRQEKSPSPSPPSPTLPKDGPKKGIIIIKTIETRDGKVISESTHTSEE